MDIAVQWEAVLPEELYEGGVRVGWDSQRTWLAWASDVAAAQHAATESPASGGGGGGGPPPSGLRRSSGKRRAAPSAFASELHKTLRALAWCHEGCPARVKPKGAGLAAMDSLSSPGVELAFERLQATFFGDAVLRKLKQFALAVIPPASKAAGADIIPPVSWPLVLAHLRDCIVVAPAAATCVRAFSLLSRPPSSCSAARSRHVWPSWHGEDAIGACALVRPGPDAALPPRGGR